MHAKVREAGRPWLGRHPQRRRPQGALDPHLAPAQVVLLQLHREEPSKSRLAASTVGEQEAGDRVAEERPNQHAGHAGSFLGAGAAHLVHRRRLPDRSTVGREDAVHPWESPGVGAR